MKCVAAVISCGLFLKYINSCIRDGVDFMNVYLCTKCIAVGIALASPTSRLLCVIESSGISLPARRGVFKKNFCAPTKFWKNVALPCPRRSTLRIAIFFENASPQEIYNTPDRNCLLGWKRSVCSLSARWVFWTILTFVTKINNHLSKITQISVVDLRCRRGFGRILARDTRRRPSHGSVGRMDRLAWNFWPNQVLWEWVLRSCACRCHYLQGVLTLRVLSDPPSSCTVNLLIIRHLGTS